MGDASHRADDPPGLDTSGMREPVTITVSRDDLAKAFAQNIRRSTIWGIVAGTLAGVIVSAAIGIYAVQHITDVVRKDVGHAAITNCDRTKTSAAALRQFLTSDAAFNSRLGALDVTTAAIDHDLARRVAALGHVIPVAIAHDYQAQSSVFQQLARLRAQVADLWAGITPRKGKKDGTKSLAGGLLVATRAHCDQILAAPVRP